MHKLSLMNMIHWQVCWFYPEEVTSSAVVQLWFGIVFLSQAVIDGRWLILYLILSSIWCSAAKNKQM